MTNPASTAVTAPLPVRPSHPGLRAAAALALVLALAACGGGGGGDTPPPAGGGVAGGGSAGGAGGNSAGGAGAGGGTGNGSGGSAGAALATDIVVLLRPGADAAALAATHGARLVEQFGRRPIWRLRLDDPTRLNATLARIAADPRVQFAEANAEAESPEERDQLVWAIGGDAGVFATQWVPQALALPAAHALSRGAGRRVAVLDSGVDLAHPQLAPVIARTTAGAVLGRDFVDDDADPSEVGTVADRGWGHGTHVAGLVHLAAPEARLMPVRVLDASGRGNVWVLAEALAWAADPDGNPATDDGAHIVNLSLSTPRPTKLLDVVVELLTCSDDDIEFDYGDSGFDADRERCNQRGGIVVMAAAGNGGSATDVQYPAAEGAEAQLAITAGNASFELAAFANRGPWVQLVAPGDRVMSTIPGGGYATWSGTSMAAPLAAGVAALVWSAQPAWKAVDVTKRLLDRGQALCGTGLLGLHAHGAVADFVPAPAACPP